MIKPCLQDVGLQSAKDAGNAEQPIGFRHAAPDPERYDLDAGLPRDGPRVPASVMLTTTGRNRSRSMRRTRRESIRSAPPVSSPVIRWTIVAIILSVSPRDWIFDRNTEHKQHHAMAGAGYS